VRFLLTRDPKEFAAQATPFLSGRVECNVLMTVLMNVLDGVYPRSSPLFAYGLDDGGAVGYAAVRTPPWSLISSALDPYLAPRLLEMWVKDDPELPGVSGQPTTAQGIAAAWTALTGAPTHCTMREAMHVLRTVIDPSRPAPGHLRLARGSERDLMVEWTRKFVYEAGLVVGDHAAAMVDARLDRDRLLVWDHHGPVSMVGIAQEVARLVRIGPVYTPPELRRRGFASSAVAETSRRALARGARECALFADLANPTSNKIYAEVGFRRFVDWEEHSFSRP
jgi:predicted GNAT family acetyltransferase